jgi:hypothetical protein
MAVVTGLYVVPVEVNCTVNTALAPVADETTVGVKLAKVRDRGKVGLVPERAKPPSVFNGAPVTPPVVAAVNVGATVN